MLKPSKCHLFQRRVNFLGHVITEDGVMPDPEKIRAVKEWGVPRNTSDIRSLIGLCAYYRRFIKSFSTRARPLLKLLEAGQAFDWTEECEKAFLDLKNALTGDEVMAYPTDDGEYILDTDASNTGIGATLSQIQHSPRTGNWEERPIAYASKTLTRCQRRYCVTRKELLSVVTFMQQFKPYLLGRKFLLRTDHSSLRWVMSFKEPQDQMARWMEILSQYNFNIEHRPGIRHGNADGLSRAPCEPDECQCYDGQTILEQLPCNGCPACTKKHQEWSSFMELDDVVPLSARRVVPEIDADTPPLSERASKQSQGVLVTLLLWLTTVWSAIQGCLHAGRRLGRYGAGKLPTGFSLGGRLTEKARRLVLPCRRTDANHAGQEDVQDQPTNWAGGFSASELADLQKQDPVLGKVIAWFDTEERPTRDEVAGESPAVRYYWLSWDQLVLEQGILYRRWDSPEGPSTFLKLVVPEKLQETVLQSGHDSITSAHLGVKKTYSKLQKKFFWYQLKTSVSEWIRKCAKCGARKSPNRKARARLTEYTVGAPLDRVDTDVLGPFPVSSSGNRFIVVFQDKMTKWTEAYPVPNYTAAMVAKKFVYEFVSRLGLPLEVHSDQGRNYEAKLFQEVCKFLEIHKSRTTPWHPSANGGCERFNKVLADMIAAFVDKEQKEWDDHLPLLTAAYRSCKHETTGHSPNMLMFGREVHIPAELVLGSPQPGASPQSYGDYVQELRQRMNMVHKLAREHTQAATERQRRDHDTRISMRKYKAGDLVDFVNKNKQVGKSPKLEPNKWVGPCVVLKVYSDLHYAVKQGPKSKLRLLHHDNIKPHLGDPAQAPDWVKLQQLQSADAGQQQTPPLCTQPEDTVQPVGPVGMAGAEVTQCTDTEQGQETGGDAVSASSPRSAKTKARPDNLVPEMLDQHTGQNKASDLRRSQRVGRPPDRFGCVVNSDCSIAL